ncbi:MAG: phosphotransferase, partial [Actinomycetota bacterium]
AVCYPYVEGTSPDTSHRADVERMGTTLASLHRTLASIELPALPPTTALAGAGPPGDHDQPLHGDFGAPNLLTTTDGLRIIDFGDAGTGSIAFELGNSLYLDLFDSWVAGDPERHGRFRTWFLDAYAERAGRGIDTDLVNEATRIRMETLRRWLDQPDQAPPGIRGATPAWHGRLRSFLSDAPAMIDP